MNKRKRVTYTLSPEMIERLKEHSKETRIPQSQLVELALIEYLEKSK